MNTNPPKDNTPLEGDQWKVIHIDRQRKTCLIRKGKGKSYPCVLADWLVEGIMHSDFVDVKYNTVSKEWTVVNYHINMEIYGALHNEIQDTLPVAERDYCYNAEGVKYE